MQHKRFFFSLASLAAGGLLVIASLAFGPHAVFGVGLGIGVAGLIGSLWFVASMVHDRALAGAQRVRVLGRRINLWLLLGCGVVGVALWETVQSAVFVADVAKWLTFSNGLVLGALAFTALIVHEISTERVIHVLQVIDRRDPRL